MKKRKAWFFASLGLILLVATGWLFRPYPTIDESRVHPSLRGLDDLVKFAWTSFGDGGSMMIHVQRTDGSQVVLCMSNSLDHSFFERGQLYLGAMHFSMPGATKITGYDHTPFVVAKMLARDLPKDPHLRGEIAILTKRFPDWISLLFEAGPKETFEYLRISQ
jgi:hypothetical protein